MRSGCCRAISNKSKSAIQKALNNELWKTILSKAQVKLTSASSPSGELEESVIAIIFALKTKEVYISLLIGIVSGTLLLTNFHLVESLNLLFDTVVNCLSKPSNIGILIFLVIMISVSSKISSKE